MFKWPLSFCRITRLSMDSKDCYLTHDMICDLYTDFSSQQLNDESCKGIYIESNFTGICVLGNNTHPPQTTPRPHQRTNYHTTTERGFNHCML